MDLTLIFLRLTVFYMFRISVLMAGSYLCNGLSRLLACKRGADRIFLVTLNITVSSDDRVSIRVVRYL